MRTLNYDRATGIISDFLLSRIALGEQNGVVVGISGGVDSALTAALATLAQGKEKVLGLIMPYFDTADVEDAQLVCTHLDIPYKLISIKPVVDAFLQQLEALEPDTITKGNLMARTRMMLLYAHANREHRFVLGTGNRSEWLTGYFTKWGDGACDLAPILPLYKTEVWEMGKRLGLPSRILSKPPSAGLWIGQTDEGELGISYQELDKILYFLTEKKYTPLHVARELNIPLEKVSQVDAMMRSTAHKRHMPEAPVLY